MLRVAGATPIFMGLSVGKFFKNNIFSPKNYMLQAFISLMWSFFQLKKYDKRAIFNIEKNEKKINEFV